MQFVNISTLIPAAIEEQDTMLLPAIITEHSPTLEVEAIFWAQLGGDREATISEIPTVPLLVDPESIQLDPLSALEWMRVGAASPYVHYIRSDLF